MAKKPFRYAVLEVVGREMRANKELCYFYEYQSPTATLPTGEILNLWKEFGDVRTSAQGWPLDETWYVGAATGLAATGIPVVVELPSMTTVFPFEQIFNQVGNFRMMTGGQYNMPIVIWIDGAARAGGSAQQHSQVGQEALYANIPGLKVVAPSNAYDAAGLMAAAIHDPDPVIYWNYSEVASGEQPDVPDDAFEVPIGKAAVRQEGKDVTLVAWAPATVDVDKALPDLQKAGLSVEYIDLRTIKPFDEATVLASAKKTGKLFVVDHGYWTNGFSANVLAIAAQKVPGLQVARITFPDAAGPASKEMIGWMRPDAPKIVAAVTQFVKG
jgi:pyruvate dehydrogenase E1 component beta subunit